MSFEPAYSTVFTPDALRKLKAASFLESFTSEEAWGESTGRGVRVFVVDSGIDADHPAVKGPVTSYVSISEGRDGLIHDTEPHSDCFGHGTACAGIIRSIAPECELHSVRVLGPRLTGRGVVFAAGLRWAIEHGAQVCNLSLGTTKSELFGPLHELADLAYFRGVLLVTSANNMPVPSYPSVFASVISVAAHAGQDPYTFYYNPSPPVEFGAPGIDVRVPWLDGQWLTVTGNSFAAPHIAGIVARILAKHPELTPFEIKTVLRALAANVTREAQPGAAAASAASTSR